MTEQTITGPVTVQGSFEASSVTFQIDPDVIVKFGPDGEIEFGAKYRDNPDEAAKAFIDCVLKRWPNLRG